MQVDRFGGELFGDSTAAKGRAERDNPPATVLERRVQLLATALRGAPCGAGEGADPQILALVRARAVR